MYARDWLRYNDACAHTVNELELAEIVRGLANHSMRALYDLMLGHCLMLGVDKILIYAVII